MVAVMVVVVVLVVVSTMCRGNVQDLLFFFFLSSDLSLAFLSCNGNKAYSAQWMRSYRINIGTNCGRQGMEIE
jgi:hypothetical protein